MNWDKKEAGLFQYYSQLYEKIYEKYTINVLKTIEIKGFIGRNRRNENRYRYYELDFINILILGCFYRSSSTVKVKK